MKLLKIGDDLVCKLGESAKENWELVGDSKKHHWFFHLTDFPSPYVVLECARGDDPNVHIRTRCAEICLEHSKQKHNKNVKVDATTIGNVKIDRRDVVGECDYKNESKVEIIVVHGGKKKEKAEEDCHEAEEEQQQTNITRGGGGGKRSGAKRGEKTGSPVVLPSEAEGKHVTVRKPKNGWATLSFAEVAVRNWILREHEEVRLKSGIVAKLSAQVDQETKEEVPTELFAFWGRGPEDRTAMAAQDVVRVFDALAAHAAEAVQRAAPARASSERVSIRKAAKGGVAVISFQDAADRDAVLGSCTGEVSTASGITVTIKPQVDPKTKADVPTDIFAAWGRKVEETTPLSELEILQCFESLLGLREAPSSNLSEAAVGSTSTD
mmetsp:Transcript_135021/g.262934  ORF Transcript_135021/g.262934 Transcript_135021/m.262934 type:complete len:381 (-) Transcript_135021:99-1241(-)